MRKKKSTMLRHGKKDKPRRNPTRDVSECSANTVKMLYSSMRTPFSGIYLRREQPVACQATATFAASKTPVGRRRDGVILGGGVAYKVSCRFRRLRSHET